MTQVSLSSKVLKESTSPMFDVIDAHSFKTKYIQGFQVESHIANFTSFPHIVSKKKKIGQVFKMSPSMKRIKNASSFKITWNIPYFTINHWYSRRFFMSCANVIRDEQSRNPTTSKTKFFVTLVHKELHCRCHNELCITIKSLPVGINLFKISNRHTRKRGEMCSKLTIKTSDWRQLTLFWCLYC